MAVFAVQSIIEISSKVGRKSNAFIPTIPLLGSLKGMKKQTFFLELNVTCYTSQG